MRRPAGSSALVGSSSSSSRGEPTSACAIPSRCCMPFDIASTRVAAADLQADELEQLVALAGAPVRVGEPLVQHEQLVRAEPVWEAKQLGQVAERRPSGGAAGWRARHAGAAAARAHEPAGDLHERRLACAVGTEQAEQLSARNLQVDAAERPLGPVALLQGLAGESG